MRPAGDGGELAGVLVVDKPQGMTSHDVVQRVRRLLGVRRVGHAGTLDPLASGVLVVMVGEATKLAPFLTAEDKRYVAIVQLGIATSTLDAEGAITEQAALPAWLGQAAERDARLGQVVAQERARREQCPPQYSAIKVGGRAAYSRARAGEQFALSPRPVTVLELRCAAVTVTPAEPPADATAPGALDSAELELELTVSKGYYVRSLARDLGLGLGLPAHLKSLRRVRSGPFELARAVGLDADRDALGSSLIALDEAARMALPAATLDLQGEARAAVGKPVEPQHFSVAPPRDVPSAWFDPRGRLVAVGELGSDGHGRVLRGFGRPDGAVAPPPHAR